MYTVRRKIVLAKMKAPSISVGLPVYNGEKYLRFALESILHQDFGDFELIISDNASTDGTPHICQQYASKDNRIRYLRNETNLGAKWNYTRVFEAASGAYFKWHPYDDECHASMLRLCLDAIERSKAAVLVYPRCEHISESGDVIRCVDEHIGSSAIKPHMRLRAVLAGIDWGHPFYGLCRADALRRTRGFGLIAADYVILAELALLGQIIELPDVLYRLRIHSQQPLFSLTRSELQAWHDPTAALKRFFLPYKASIVLEYLRGIHHLPLRPIDKIKCSVTAMAVPFCREFVHACAQERDRVERNLKRLKTMWNPEA
jgi:hypothetical protein